jgi:hypothetical protein
MTSTVVHESRVVQWPFVVQALLEGPSPDWKRVELVSSRERLAAQEGHAEPVGHVDDVLEKRARANSARRPTNAALAATVNAAGNDASPATSRTSS